ncbi:GNAT family N-acetyltransferase [Bacillus sp. FJAT-49736]|uniref:GNAT family N-acetyltransferase n=1 Tax=Bacillus sp. FJAT-49736 TaxID=2833582 RepID=UPI001BCA3EE0|nr:GNAT family N-acetyltransferase [Bacillus sp. FJAT-49736]MBS4171848.1 GNAT family N-acetyltransferase [Bacillus sp. FJAT-49736]
MIRHAKKNDPELYVKDISELTYEILKDLGINVLDQQSKAKIVEFLKELFYKEGNRFSYHNILVKEMDGRIVGIAIIYHGKDAADYDKNFVSFLQEKFDATHVILSKETETDEFYLDSLAVSANYRNKGIGGQLLKAFEEKGYAMEYSKLSLNVDRDNEKAYHLYLKNGYEYESTFDLYGHPYLHMVKKLS